MGIGGGGGGSSDGNDGGGGGAAGGTGVVSRDPIELTDGVFKWPDFFGLVGGTLGVLAGWGGTEGTDVGGGGAEPGIGGAELGTGGATFGIGGGFDGASGTVRSILDFRAWDGGLDVGIDGGIWADGGFLAV